MVSGALRLMFDKVPTKSPSTRSGLEDDSKTTRSGLEDDSKRTRSRLEAMSNHSRSCVEAISEVSRPVSRPEIATFHTASAQAIRGSGAGPFTIPLPLTTYNPKLLGVVLCPFGGATGRISKRPGRLRKFAVI